MFINDQELIYLIKHENSKNAWEIIKNKYLKIIWKKQIELTKVMTKDKFQRYWDMDLSPIFTMFRAIDNHDIKNTKFTFFQSLLLINKANICNAFRLYYQKKNYVLNNSIELTDIISKNVCDEYDVEEKIQDKILLFQQKQATLNFLSNIKNKTMKQVVRMRLNNKPIDVISKTLNISIQRVNSHIFYFIKKFKFEGHKEIKKYSWISTR